MIQSAAAVLNLRMKTHPALYEASFTDKREHVQKRRPLHARYSVFDFPSVVRFSCTHSGSTIAKLYLARVLSSTTVTALAYFTRNRLRLNHDRNVSAVTLLGGASG